VCDCSLRHPACNAHAPCWHLWLAPLYNISPHYLIRSRSQWPRGLRRRSTAARLLRLWVWTPPGEWMFVCCECCVLSGRGLCDRLIIRPEESYRLCCVVVCDLETSWMRRPWSTGGCCTKNKQTKKLSHKRYDFRKVIGHKMCVFSFTKTFVCSIFLSKKKWARYDKKCILVFIHSTLYSYPILMKLEFSRQIFEKYSNIKFHENPLRGSRDVACGQRDGQDEVVFGNFEKEPKNIEVLKYSKFYAQFSLFIKNMFVTLSSSTCFEH